VPEPLRIGGHRVARGSRATIELPLPQLYTHTPMTLPVHVVRGRREGPTLFVCAAIHGDELNGVEIIRRLLRRPGLKELRGTLLAVPMVNVFGVIQNSRYLPDRRDLNRVFPGSERGSLASRVAHLFMSEIVSNATHGVDLHTGAVHRSNLPQVRANLDDAATQRLAYAFGVPVVLNAYLRDGSLRQAAAECGVPLLLYEAGEALRFDEFSIRVGVQGVVNVMRELGMLRARRARSCTEPYVAHSSSWVRAPQSGIFRAMLSLGARVHKGALLGAVSDPFGESESEVRAAFAGVVIGRTNIPLVHAGEALFHVARFERVHELASELEAFQIGQEEAVATDREPPIV